MWPFRKRRVSPLKINANKEEVNIKYSGNFEDVKLWAGGQETSSQLLEERELLKTLLVNSSLYNRHPKFEGAALIFTLTKEKIVCDLVIEIRPPNGKIDMLDVQKITTDGRIIVYFQNNCDIPLYFQALPEFLLTGNLLLPWKAGLTVMFFPHALGFGEVITWQTTYDDPEEIKLLPAEIEIIINRCEVILEHSIKMKNECNL